MQSPSTYYSKGFFFLLSSAKKKEEAELEEMEVASQSLHPDVSQIASNAAATTSRRPFLLFMNLSIPSTTNQQVKTASLQQQTTPQ